jgi:glycosyltransferase involved in cell wall biosynthesis
MPNVTVIIPVLNSMPYLPEALASLESQTFRDFEVILWDNGSSDGSLEEARRWIPRRLPGEVVSGTPLPLQECLARMVRQSKTELVARMDGDDVCLPDRLQSEVDFLMDNPSCAVVGGQMELIDENGRSIGKAQRLPQFPHEIFFSFLFRNPVAHPTVLFRRNAILDAGNYTAPKPIEDYDLWMRVGKSFQLANLPLTVLKYRRHENAVCGGADKPVLELDSHMASAIGSHAYDLYGISQAAYTCLRKKASRFAFGSLFPAIASTHKRTGAPVRKIVFSRHVSKPRDA